MCRIPSAINFVVGMNSNHFISSEWTWWESNPQLVNFKSTASAVGLHVRSFSNIPHFSVFSFLDKVFPDYRYP